MSLLVPNVGEVQALTKWLNQTLTLKLYSNNLTPAEGDTAASYTEVAGGGYASKSLTFANWTIGTAAGVTSAQYTPAQDFTFTGVTNAPGTVYGYYIVDGSNNLLWSERFSESFLPFEPVANSLIRVTPRIEAA
jgi:hypothetical protein